jgi:hypothetical protein
MYRPRKSDHRVERQQNLKQFQTIKWTSIENQLFPERVILTPIL